MTLGVCAFLPSSRCSSACSGPAAPQIHTHESICWLVLSTSRPCCSRGCVIRPMPSRPHQVCRGSAARPNCPCPAESPHVSVGVTLLAEAAAVTLLARRRPVRCRCVCLCVCTCVCVHRQEAGGGINTILKQLRLRYCSVHKKEAMRPGRSYLNVYSNQYRFTLCFFFSIQKHFLVFFSNIDIDMGKEIVLGQKNKSRIYEVENIFKKRIYQVT